ncbi:MAG TPA: NAD(P) transhydrogenase subunit alpha [Thermoleophilaceae bacterium]|nr:NAD(P) transhydrogenase subunit alpha [Thermoleophilaceae bacterium]
MAAELLSQFVVLVLAVALGFELISRVPSLLHTPLMSATNAIHGIVVVGALVIVLTATETLTLVLGLVAVFFGTVNVVGGFIVTNRMLEMFRGGARGR